MLNRSLLIALCAFAPACDDSSERRPNPMPLAGWQGPPPHVAIDVVGPAAENDKRERCMKLITRSGAVPDPAAPVRAVLMLQDGGNRLQVVSQRRGVVRDEARPGWDMEHLCSDALSAMLFALRQELTPAAPPPPPTAMSPESPPPGTLPPPSAPAAQAPAATDPTMAAAAKPAGPALAPLAPARAAPRKVAELAARGHQLFTHGDFAGALAAYVEASQGASNPALLFDIGLCHVRLNRVPEALRHLQQYLDRAPRASNRAQTERLMAQLRHDEE